MGSWPLWHTDPIPGQWRPWPCAWWAQWAQLGSKVVEPLGPPGSCQRLESRQLLLSLFWSVGSQGLRPAYQSLKDSASASAIDLHLERDKVRAQGPH